MDDSPEETEEVPTRTRAGSERGGEISLRSEGGRRRYVRVGEGDPLREGDREPISPTLREWRVERIGGTTVTLVDERTDERQTWTRSRIERRLATGAMSTTLGAVERTRVREWSRPAGRQYLTVLADGDDGRTYVRRYRSADREGRVLEPFTRDPGERWLTAAGRASLDEAVATALTAAGFVPPESR